MTAKKLVPYTEHYADVMKALTTDGLLLGVYDAAGKANLMTIGWGAMGSIWGKPLWVVLVRPSRYTYDCLNSAGAFTVNVPKSGHKKACEICGSKSGRSADKFALAGLTHEKAETVNAPAIAECPLVYECKVVHTNEVVAAQLSKEILSGAYKSGDFHRLYYGEILAVRAAAGAAKALARSD